MTRGPPAGVSRPKPPGSSSAKAAVGPQTTLSGATETPPACTLAATPHSTTCWSPSKILGAEVPASGPATRFTLRTAGEAAERLKGQWGKTGPRGHHLAES